MGIMRDSQWIVELAHNWATNVNNELSKLNLQDPAEREGELCSGAYQPQTVSIGPELCRRSMLMRLSCQKTNKPNKSWPFISECFPSGGGLKKGDVYIRSAMELTRRARRAASTTSRSREECLAFERFHVGAGNEVTSFVFFMDRIIDSARDVGLLHSCGIIQNALGSDKAVANLFNSLSRDAVDGLRQA